MGSGEKLKTGTRVKGVMKGHGKYGDHRGTYGTVIKCYSDWDCIVWDENHAKPHSCEGYHVVPGDIEVVPSLFVGTCPICELECNGVCFSKW